MHRSGLSSCPASGWREGAKLELERIRVLLVEDDANDAEMISRLLARCTEPSCHCIHVRELSAAGPLVQNGDFHVVLLDLSLPDSDGLAGLRELALAAPKLPIVVLTGLEEKATAIQAIRSGAQDYLVKGNNDPALLHRSLCHAIERKAFERGLAERAHFDRLTGLVNRTLFEDRLQLAIARARRTKGQVGLMFIDLDGFKEINDSLGHATGDEVLRCVAEHLRCAVRESESVARLGGDEFTVLLDPMENAAATRMVAERILRAIGTPLMLSGRQVRVTGSVGVALFPDHANDAESLLQRADAAMFRAKGLGRNKYQIYGSY